MELTSDTISLNALIDHTLLRPLTGSEDIKRLCSEAAKYQFAAVCIPPYFINKAMRLLEKTPVKVATVVGFPLGYSCIPSKVEETKRAIGEGAAEIDMVINLSAFKDKDYATVLNDIQSVTTICHIQNTLIKVIIESGILSTEEIIKACELCIEAEVDFVKTSTGFNGPGASVDAVKLMRKILPPKIKIKASGGIKTRDFALELVNAGAGRLGCSSSIDLVKP